MLPDLPDHLDRMLTRLKLTAIRDQLDSLLDEAGRRELTIREALTMLCEPVSSDVLLNSDATRNGRLSNRRHDPRNALSHNRASVQQPLPAIDTRLPGHCPSRCLGLALFASPTTISRKDAGGMKRRVCTSRQIQGILR